MSRGEQHYYKLSHQINLTGWPVQSVEDDQKNFSVSSWVCCVLMKKFILCLSDWLWIGAIKIKRTSYDSHASKRTAGSTQTGNTEMCRRKKVISNSGFLVGFLLCSRRNSFDTEINIIYIYYTKHTARHFQYFQYLERTELWFICVSTSYFKVHTTFEPLYYFKAMLILSRLS